MPETRETRPARVPTARHAGETDDQWSWVEPSIWTERMLTALENGVKGGKWHSLIDKIYSPSNLKSAWMKVKRNKGSAGSDHQTTKHFEKRQDHNLEQIHIQIKTGTYHPNTIKRTWIPKPGKRNEKRPLGIPTVRDRVVQTALRHAIEPIFENDFSNNSYGFRPKRGCKDALREVTRRLKIGYTWVVDVDIKSYFDTIDHDILKTQIRQKISDTRTLELIDQYLTQETLDTAKRWIPERGSPQGAAISPLLSNIYLDPLDKQMEKEGYNMVRYADDMVILCKTELEADTALKRLKIWTEQLKLTLHPEKTRIVDNTLPGGFDFLGYHFERNGKRPSKKSLNKFKDSIRQHTRRTNGHSMKQITEQLKPILRGWFNYFKHSHKWTFKPLDKWTRMRLRSILRKRSGRKGRGRGLDHNRWPNTYFAELGLFSLQEAWESACQSAKR